LACVLGLGEALEQGTLRLPCSGLLTKAWRVAMTRSLCRRLSWPAHTRVVAIGGATLGGSGKTPLAIACAAELSSLGISTALIGHAHRAKPRVAREVTEGDSIEEVGDEALVATRALRGLGVKVIVGPTRQAAIDLGARLARVLVLDGVAQTLPASASLALLAVDAAEPWGLRRAMPPRGDLRADCSELVEVCDAVVPVGGLPCPTPAEWLGLWGTSVGREVCPAGVGGRGALLGSGELVSWAVLRRIPVGLITALGRSDRVVRSLTDRGIRPRVVVRGADHGPLPANLVGRASKAAKESGIALWLTTPKCSVHVARVANPPHALGAPLATLEHVLVLSASLVARLRRLAEP
jgi:tetraacyldisaccharide-1-P 4'-kinase